MPKNWLSLRRLFDFRGRASRREYFLFHMICFAAILLPIITMMALFAPEPVTDPVHTTESVRTTLPFMLFGALYLAVQLSAIVGLFAVAVRRLHDQGKSWWHMLFGLIPLIGWIITLMWIFAAGDEGENEFGPDPREGEVNRPSYEGVFD